MADIGGIIMVTNRTQADVTRAEYLNQLGWRNMNASERTEYLEALKGSYSYTDLNRVESAVQVVADILNSYGYNTSLAVRTDWALADIPTAPELARYLDNIQALVYAFHVLPTTPPLPLDMDSLTFAEANALEQILLDIHLLVQGMVADFIHADEIEAGEADFI